MSRLKKAQSSKRTLENYAAKSIIVCTCPYCICPPPQVPNDIELRKTASLSRAKSVEASS